MYRPPFTGPLGGLPVQFSPYVHMYVRTYIHVRTFAVIHGHTYIRMDILGGSLREWACGGSETLQLIGENISNFKLE